MARPRIDRTFCEVAYNGQTKTLAQWAELTGIPYPVLSDRYGKKWSAEKMLTTPACAVQVPRRAFHLGRHA